MSAYIYNSPKRAQRRTIAREYIAAVRAKTYCLQCGAQPVDFHREEHEQRPHWRVAKRVAAGHSPETIAREISMCVPLCRRCHMTHDGRLPKFVIVAKRPRTKTDPTPCMECGRLYKPLRRKRCKVCYHRLLRHEKRPVPLLVEVA